MSPPTSRFAGDETRGPGNGSTVSELKSRREHHRDDLFMARRSILPLIPHQIEGINERSPSRWLKSMHLQSQIPMSICSQPPPSPDLLGCWFPPLGSQNTYLKCPLSRGHLHAILGTSHHSWWPTR